MEIKTTRFGTVRYQAEDVIHFPQGIVGMEDVRDWILLSDADNDALGWLQSVNWPEVALGVVSPRRFVPDYRIRIARSDLQPLQVDDAGQTRVLVIVSRNDDGCTLNLKAPLIFHLEVGRGCQVVVKDDHPVQYVPVSEVTQLRKSA